MIMSDEESFDFFDDGFEQRVVTVTDIQRYIVDPVFLQQTGLTDQAVYDAYDLTVADGRRRARVVLSCLLDHMVQKRKIRVGSRVKLTMVKVRFDETTLNGPGIPVVEDLTVVSQHHTAAVDDLNKLPWYPENDASKVSQPLASRRGYYMDLWSNTDVAKTADDGQVQLQVCGSLGSVSTPDLYSVREIAARWPSLRAVKPRLLLRVLRRSKLHHYARTNKTDRWPFQLHMVVGDETGCCTTVFWNVMATRYMNFVQEGSVVLVRGFTVKPRFQMAGRPVWQPPGLAWHDVDLNVNAHNPQTEVTLLDHSHDAGDLQGISLPDLTTYFVSRRQLRYIPDGSVCDVSGVVTFVGAVQREKAKGKLGLGSGGFWVKRWLHLQDHSSSLPFVIQLYQSVQKQEFEYGLVVGAFVVCRNMRVIHGLEDARSSRQPRHVYVTSTKDTQLYINEVDEDVDYPFPDDPVLRSARRFARTADCGAPQEGGMLGHMMFSFPPKPTIFDDFTAQHFHLELTPCSGWVAMIDSLTYRETTQIAVQAGLMGVAFHHGHHSVRRSKRTHRPPSQEPATRSLSVTSDDSTVYLGFNPMAEDSGESLSEYVSPLEEESFFSLQWRGLNADIILNTVRGCRLNPRPPHRHDLTLDALLSGACDPDLARPGGVKAAVDLPEDVVRRVMRSVAARSTSMILNRYLVLLDVYCVDGENVVIGVNRAFPLTR